ncbi:YdaU family protein [Phaeobacter sp. G2]|nr:YdaU family protein [Phaeobacter sp. G2]
MSDLIEGQNEPADVWPLRRGDTLSSHDWFPFYTHRFLGSRFLSRCVMLGRREDVGTAVILWTESMRQDPAGTLPGDDIDLADLARFRSIEDWQEAKENVLHGWVPVLVEDARTGEYETRLGHPGIIEAIVTDMNKRKRGRDAAREAGRLALKKHKIRTKMRDMGVQEHIIKDDRAITALAEHFEHSELYITPDNVRAAMAEVLGYTGEVTPISAARDR